MKKLALSLSLLTLSPSVFAEQVILHAAGSLKAALTEVTQAYEKTYGVTVTNKFAPSGLLRKDIESGTQVDVFASANMGHPQKLAKAEWGSSVVLFARNQLCALTQADIQLDQENFLASLLNKNIRLGTSTPKADPSGDYAWQLFEKAEIAHQGAFQALSTKALQLTGGENSAPAPKGKNQYGWVMAENKADVFLTYCTNAVLAQKEVPSLKIVEVPAQFAVGADYGLTVNLKADKQAWQFANFMLSTKGQAILKSYGFEAPNLKKY